MITGSQIITKIRDIGLITIIRAIATSMSDRISTQLIDRHIEGMTRDIGAGIKPMAIGKQITGSRTIAGGTKTFADSINNRMDAGSLMTLTLFFLTVTR